MNITARNENGKQVICLAGRIDSSNSALAAEKITELRGENPQEGLIIDCDDLKYISSAGLRILLKLRKDDADLKLINVSSEIYDILEMTGFTEMMEVTKAFRRIDVEGCEVIGRGSNGKVYRIDADTIVKYYRNPDSLDEIKHEREVARRALILGIPTAIPYDVVRVGDGYGSVFEMLNAVSFSELITEHPENLEEYADLYVDLLKKIHATEVKEGEFPSQKEVAVKWVGDLNGKLPEETWQKLHDMVEAIPETPNMIHGDLHTKNIMMQDGEVLLIDMDTLAQGNPVFEFSAIYNAYIGFGEYDPSRAAGFIGIDDETAKKLWKMIIEKYFGTSDEAVLQGYIDKARVISYTRLYRRTMKRHPEAEDLIAYYREKLIELTEKTDSLAY